MNGLGIKSATICLMLAVFGSVQAQNPNPTQKGPTKFGLPVAKSDNSGKDALVSSSPTAAAPENRSDTAMTRKSSTDFPTNLASVSRIFVTFEGSAQGKFKGTARPGMDPGSECLTYVFQPHPGSGGRPSISITKELDAVTSQLLKALETAEPLKTVTFEFVEDGAPHPKEALPGKGTSRVKATLTGASIVSIQQHFDAKTHGLFEDITLNFSKIEYSQ